MYTRIYFDERPLFLTDSRDPFIEEYLHHDDAVFIDELNVHSIKSMIHEMQKPDVHAGIFLHPDLPALQHEFFKKFTILQAAGGLVSNDAGEWLLIFRRDKWDLPKGKLDEGETLEGCAVREVQEETGLKEIELLSPLLITYHTYHQGSSFILKESHWYKMRAPGAQPLTPQTEEDIEAIKWVGTGELTPYMDNAFASVVDVLKAGLAK